MEKKREKEGAETALRISECQQSSFHHASETIDADVIINPPTADKRFLPRLWQRNKRIVCRATLESDIYLYTRRVKTVALREDRGGQEEREKEEARAKRGAWRKGKERKERRKR